MKSRWRLMFHDRATPGVASRHTGCLQVAGATAAATGLGNRRLQGPFIALKRENKCLR